MTRKSEPGYSGHTNMKYEQESFIFLGANMKYEAGFQISKKYEIFNIIPTTIVLNLLYSFHRHSSLSLVIPRTPPYMPAPFDDLSPVDESWQSGIIFEDTGARYQEEWATRVLLLVVISNTNY